jgi:hypothetical protein
VANGSGAFDLTGLVFLSRGGVDAIADIIPILGAISVASGHVDAYVGFSGPSNFGGGGLTFPSSNSGDPVGIFSFINFLLVPENYVSGTALSGTSAYNNATFASLGATPGTYVWSWGTGLENQNFTLVIGPAGVPDGGSTVSLLGCTLLGLAYLRRKLRC